MKPLVFYSRCRPQECDAIELVRQENRVFIGYPAWRPGKPYRRGHIRESIVDVTCPNDEWAIEMAAQSSTTRNYTRNRNLAAAVAPGSIALVPRPSLGVVFAGRVQGCFELVNDPPWADAYLEVRARQGKWTEDEEGRSHVGDVVQCWRVDHFRAVPLSIIPAWIRSCLFGRSTYGIVRGPEGFQLDPFASLNSLIDDPGQTVREWTNEVEKIKRRLVADFGPTPFEHLCVALLQLEHPDEVWHHVGGSGDGGVDGLGADAQGHVTSLLQCKWIYRGDHLDFSSPWGTDGTVSHRRILASLIHQNGISPPDANIQFWSGDKIAALMLKHASRLPAALTLRVSA